MAASTCSLSADAPCFWQEKRVIIIIIIIIRGVVNQPNCLKWRKNGGYVT